MTNLKVLIFFRDFYEFHAIVIKIQRLSQRIHRITKNVLKKSDWALQLAVPDVTV